MDKKDFETQVLAALADLQGFKADMLGFKADMQDFKKQTLAVLAKVENEQRMMNAKMDHIHADLKEDIGLIKTDVKEIRGHITDMLPFDERLRMLEKRDAAHMSHRH